MWAVAKAKRPSIASDNVAPSTANTSRMVSRSPVALYRGKRYERANVRPSVLQRSACRGKPPPRTGTNAGAGTRTRTPLRARDFKSLASTRFATPACHDYHTNARSEDRGRKRSPGGSSRASLLASHPSLLASQSGKRDSNPRPQPWQGCALPTELFPRGPEYKWPIPRLAGLRGSTLRAFAQRVHRIPYGPGQ